MFGIQCHSHLSKFCTVCTHHFVGLILPFPPQIHTCNGSFWCNTSPSGDEIIAQVKKQATTTIGSGLRAESQRLFFLNPRRPLTKVETLVKELKTKFSAKNITLQNAFKQIDGDHSNVVDRKEFMEAMRKLKTNLTLTECDQLFTTLDTENADQINYHQFARWFEPDDAIGEELPDDKTLNVCAPWRRPVLRAHTMPD